MRCLLAGLPSTGNADRSWVGDRVANNATDLFGSGNAIVAAAGSVAGAIGVSNHNGATAIAQENTGFSVKTPLNS